MSLFAVMPTMSIRSRLPGCAAVALCLVLALPARGEEEQASVDERPVRATQPAPDAAAERPAQDHPAPPANEEEDGPTDDFGRPLRGCEVPWDRVPRD